MELNESLCSIVQADQCKITEILIESGADVNYVDKTGKFPLYYAYEKNQISQMKFLLSQKADVNKIFGESTILQIECRKTNASSEIIKILMDNGAEPNLLPKIGSALVNHPLASLAESNGIDNVRLLLSYACTNINLRNNNDSTALRIACACNYGELAKLLLDKDADPNIKGNDGQTALINSIFHGNDVMTSILLQYDNIKLDLQDKTGDTALHWACKKDKCSIIHLLLLYGAGETIKNVENKTAIEYCKNCETKLFLKNYKSSTDTLPNNDIKPVPKVDLPVIQQVPFFEILTSKPITTKKKGKIGDNYRSWNKIFLRWDPYEPVPPSAYRSPCEYVNEKISCHIINGEQVRFDYIIKEDGLCKNDLYE